MEELSKKLQQLTELLKALKPHQSVLPAVPTIPAIKPPPPPSLKPSVKAGSSDKIPGMAPTGKKDPKKIAEQIKSGEMSTKTQKVMLKAHQNGQWYLDGKDE